MDNIMLSRKVFLVLLGLCTGVFAAVPEELSAVRGKDWERAGTVAYGAYSSISNGVLAITTALASRPGLYCRTAPFFSARLERITLRYRVSGTGRGGGSLFYRVDTVGRGLRQSRFKTPPLVMDGNWHTFSIGTNSLTTVEDWEKAGVLGVSMNRACLSAAVSKSRK